MPKGYLVKKGFSSFRPSQQTNLLFMQAFTFGVYNTRLKLKEDKFRYADVLTTFIIGELNDEGVAVSEFKEIIGAQTNTAVNHLDRAASRGILYKHAGKPGRGNASRYYLSAHGRIVFDTLKKEVEPMLKQAKKMMTEQILKKRHLSY